MADFIPSGDAQFLSWFDNFQGKLVAFGAALGIGATEIGQATDNHGDALIAYNAHVAAQNNGKTATTSKSQLIADNKVFCRAIAKRLQAHPAMTDAKRNEFGITVPDVIPTAVTAPTSRPVLSTDTSNRLRIGVKLTDEASPFSNAKPKGADAMELYMSIGDVQPADINDCVYVGLARKTPYFVEFAATDGGKRVHFLGRWITRSGLTGPTSELTSTTVVA